MWVFDRQNLRFLAVNDAAIARYGFSRAQFMSMTVSEMRPPGDRERFADFLRTLSESQFVENIGEHITADGTIIDIAAYSTALTYAGRDARLAPSSTSPKPSAPKNSCAGPRNSSMRSLRMSRSRSWSRKCRLARRTPVTYRYTLVNRAFEELFGISRKQVIGKTAAEFYPKERADFIVAANNDALRAHQPIVLSDHAVHTPTKGIRIATAKSVAIRDDFGRPQYLVTVLQDVTERKRTEQRIARIAHYDSLTDLPNRITFNDALEAALERSAKNGEPFAILSLDLDGFKEANDTYGHAVGDELLAEIARRLQAAATGAFAARVGGDEFALLVDGPGLPETAVALAERVLKALREDVDIEGRRIPIGASIGAALYPEGRRRRQDAADQCRHRAVPGQGRGARHAGILRRRRWASNCGSGARCRTISAPRSSTAS